MSETHSAEKDAGDFGHAAQDVEELASVIQETFPTGAGGYSLIWEDCFPAAAAILDAGWTRDLPPDGPDAPQADGPSW